MANSSIADCEHANSDNPFIIGHLNEQSLAPRTHDVRNIIESYNAHVLGISESWLKPDSDIIPLSIPGYSLVRVDRLSKDSGGVALYIQESIKHRVICQFENHATYKLRPEFLFVELQLHRFKVLLVVIYNPPKAGFWTDVEEAFFNLRDAYDFTVLFGDLNINWAKPSTPRTILAESLEMLGLTRIPFGHTFHRGDSHTSIDHICVSDIAKVISYEQFSDSNISEHDVLFANLSLPLSKKPERVITFRDFRHYVVDSVLDSLKQAHLSPFSSFTDVNDKVNFLTSVLLRILDEHAPYRSKIEKKKPDPWFTHEIKQMITERNRLRDKFKSSGRDGGKYRQLRNRIKLVIRNARHGYYREKLMKAKNSI